MGKGAGLTLGGKIAVFLIVAASFYGAYRMFVGPQGKPAGAGAESAGGSNRSDADKNAQSGNDSPETASTDAPDCEFGIAYGTEKKRWLEWAVAEFAKSPNGRKINVNLIPFGSLEGGQAVLKGDKRIHVWSPASALYKDVFTQEWKLQQSSEPIVREEPLALSPMVFVMWDERFQSFSKKYKEVSFRSIGQALADPAGWSGIADQDQWGAFKFGHTHPNQSNSGLMTLVLMTYEFHNKTRNLVLKDILDVPLQEWMQPIERATTGLSNSTGNMMRDMVLRGPSSYDCVFVYENVAIDYLKNAQGRWGELHISYPTRNMWNDNPYYVLNVPWSSPEQRRAAGLFLDFLLTERIQAEALVHGFRPGNPAVSIKSADSPFVTYEKHGLRIDLTTICEPPSADVINNLLISWQRSQGNR